MFALVVHATYFGTQEETGKIPYQVEGVGLAFLPLIDRAIKRLKQERLDSGVALED